MSLRSRSRWIAAAAVVAVPAIVLSTACSSDKAAAPKSVASADTVALDESNVNVLEWWVNVGSDSGYYSFNGAGDGNYVEANLDGEGNRYDYRMLIQFELPKLAGKGLVDSAAMHMYSCSHGGSNSDSIVVDHVNYGAAYQDSASWGGQTIQANLGTLARDTTPGWKVLDISSSVQADYAAKRANSQYRMQFAAPIPVGDEWVEWAGSYCNDNNNTNGAAGQGYLVIWAH